MIVITRPHGIHTLGPKLLDAKKVALARVMHADKQVAITDIGAILGIGRTTLYRHINAPPGRALQHTEVRE